MSQRVVTGAPQWTPVALSRDLEPGSILGTQLHSSDIVVWRGQAGSVHAWPDRCPHRGMRLSLGFVRGDQLGCAYHGWRFTADGRCRFIPAQPEAPAPRARVGPRLRCSETAGAIWVATDSADRSQPIEPAKAAWIGVRSVYVHASADTLWAELPTFLPEFTSEPAVPTGSGVHASVDGWAVSVGVHVLTAAQTAAHVTCQVDAPVSLQLELARGAGALRDRAERRR